MNLTIRLFSVIYRTLVVEGSNPSADMQSVYSTAQPKMRRKENFMDISSGKERHLTQENWDVVKKGKPQKRSRISVNSSTKQRHKDYVKERIDKMQQISKCRLWFGLV